MKGTCGESARLGDRPSQELAARKLPSRGDGMAGESEEFERSLLGNTVRWEQDGQGASEAAWSLSQEVRVYRDCHLQNFVTFISGREFQ